MTSDMALAKDDQSDLAASADAVPIPVSPEVALTIAWLKATAIMGVAIAYIILGWGPGWQAYGAAFLLAFFYLVATAAQIQAAEWIGLLAFAVLLIALFWRADQPWDALVGILVAGLSMLNRSREGEPQEPEEPDEDDYETVTGRTVQSVGRVSVQTSSASWQGKPYTAATMHEPGGPYHLPREDDNEGGGPLNPSR